MQNYKVLRVSQVEKQVLARLQFYFDEMKEESEKAGLKLSIQKRRLWHLVLSLHGFIFMGSKITADGDCSHEIKRRLLLGRKAMTNLDSVL